MSKLISGGCLCGKVRYECVGDSVFSGNCHCRDCQKSSGAGYVPAMMFPIDNVKITGELKYYDKNGDSGRFVKRGFCPNCGSQLFAILEVVPGMLGIRAGTLDNPSDFKPALDMYTSSAAAWDSMNESLPKMPKAPR